MAAYFQSDLFRIYRSAVLFTIILTFRYYPTAEANDSGGPNEGRSLRPLMSFGKRVKDGDYPFFVSAGLFTEMDNLINEGAEQYGFVLAICSGTLVTKDIILYAAHCIWGLGEKAWRSGRVNETMYAAFLGVCPQHASQEKFDVDELHKKPTYNPPLAQTMRNITDVYIHPKFNLNDRPMEGDIAFARLQEPFGVKKLHFSKLYGCPQIFGNVKKKTLWLDTIGIGCGTIPRTDKYSKRDGMYSDKEPIIINIKATMDDKTCIFFPSKTSEKDEVVCNAPSRVKACTGDSGGPLLLKVDGEWKQIGIVKDGKPTNQCIKEFCGCAQSLSRHTFLYKFRDFIRENKVPFEDCSSKYGVSIVNFNFNYKSQAVGSRVHFMLNIFGIIACVLRSL